MNGYFDNMGTGQSSGSEFDFARNGSGNPGAVPATGFYDRMFGHKRGPGGGKNQPPVPLAPSGNPAHTPPVGGPSLTSGPGLVKRIMSSIAAGPSYNTQGQPLVPGMGVTVPELMQKVGQNVQDMQRQYGMSLQDMQRQYGQRLQDMRDGYGQNIQGLSNAISRASGGLPPFGGTGMAPMPQPGSTGPQYTPPMPSADGGPQYRPPGPAAPMPNGAPPRPAGFFAGGYARGGYPNLMLGMPQRRAHGGGSEGAVPDNGPGDGRTDNVNARLSKGEFVQDAETVALLGNGSSSAGAHGMEAIRQEIRKHKGRSLARGDFSPDARDPAHYAKIGIKAAQAYKGSKR